MPSGVVSDAAPRAPSPGLGDEMLIDVDVDIIIIIIIIISSIILHRGARPVLTRFLSLRTAARTPQYPRRFDTDFTTAREAVQVLGALALSLFLQIVTDIVDNNVDALNLRGRVNRFLKARRAVTRKELHRLYWPPTFQLDERGPQLAAIVATAWSWT